MIIEDIKIEVQRKCIKNMHLHVEPDGRVFITAPLYAAETEIESFARANVSWIRNTLKKYDSLPERTERRYETGETVFVFGEEYRLVFVPGNGNAFSINGNKAILIMKPDSTAEQRTEYMRGVFRNILSSQIESLFPKWEKITGLKAREWHIKYMKTRWGTCNPSAKRIWFSLLLVQHPVKCIEYVILHELNHFKVHNHGKDFKAEMDKFMPQWRDVKKELNIPLHSAM
ncbi:MAG: SprT family zinc-dependent metalloprotease [bacterium]|nr:SprT family zinc-dependent metalloprotease [bacterium]